MKINSTIDDQTELASFIHQAALDPHINIESLNNSCDSSRHFSFGGFCTSLSRLSEARERLGIKRKTKLISVIGFPFGSIPNELKKEEALRAAEQGAEELDLVPNFFALHQNKATLFAEEISEICEIGLLTRVILDISRLSPSKLELAIEACIDAGARGIQTGSGFGPRVSKQEICAIKDLTRERCSIKAVGGIKTYDHLQELLTAGASEIGTSFGPAIISDFQSSQQ